MSAGADDLAWDGCRVAATCGAGAGAGISAALFRHAACGQVRLATPALGSALTLTLDLDRAVELCNLEGQPPCPRPDDRRLLLVPAGVPSEIVARGPWRLLQIYLPSPEINSVAAEIGLPREACHVVFDPGFFADPEIEVIARALERRLAQGLTPTGLESDELALDVALLLVTRHARLDFCNGFSFALADCPVAGGRTSLERWERALLAEIFEQFRESPETAPRLLAGLLTRLSGGAAVSELAPRK